MARRRTSRVSPARNSSSGVRHTTGSTAQWCGHRGWSAPRKREGSTAEPSPEDERAIDRRSARPRDRARFATIPSTQVRSEDRRSYRSRERTTVSHASWTISSAMARLLIHVSARRSITPLQRSTSSLNTCSSPSRSALSNASSSLAVWTQPGESPRFGLIELPPAA